MDKEQLKKLIEETIKLGGNTSELEIWITLFEDLDTETQKEVFQSIKKQYEELKNSQKI